MRIVRELALPVLAVAALFGIYLILRAAIAIWEMDNNECSKLGASEGSESSV